MADAGREKKEERCEKYFFHIADVLFRVETE
jgi:hypothetical protein